MIRCIIIEDQPPAQRVLKKYIADIGNMDLKGTFADALKAIDFLKTETVDLIFLDIHLPKISGIEFIKSRSLHAKVILTTAFSDYALESYEYDVVDYLLKPFSFERFVQAVSKVPLPKSEQLQIGNSSTGETSPEIIFLKSGYEHIKIDISDIIFIHSDADYTEVHTDLNKHLSQEPLRFWEGYLDSQRFVRIHKSYIINTLKIDKIIGNRVHLAKKTAIPIGRAYKENFMKQVIK